MTNAANSRRSARRPGRGRPRRHRRRSASPDAAPQPQTLQRAPDGASAKAKPLRIGFSPFTLQVPALKGLADGLTAAAKAQGDTVVTADPKGDPSTQLQQLQQWVQLGQVDAIWVIPVGRTDRRARALAGHRQGNRRRRLRRARPTTASPASSPASRSPTSTTPTTARSSARSPRSASTQRLGGNGQGHLPAEPDRGAEHRAPSTTQFKKTLAEGVAEHEDREPAGSRRTASARSRSSRARCRAPPTRTRSSAPTTSRPSAASTPSPRPARTRPRPASSAPAATTEAQAAVKSGKLYADLAFDFQADLDAEPQAAAHARREPLGEGHPADHADHRHHRSRRRERRMTDSTMTSHRPSASSRAACPQRAPRRAAADGDGADGRARPRLPPRPRHHRALDPARGDLRLLGAARTSSPSANAALVANAAALTAVFAAAVGFGILSGALDLSIPGSGDDGGGRRRPW